MHDIAEQLPGLALEAGKLDRLDRIEVGRAGVDRDAGQQQRKLQIVMIGGLAHDILTRQVVAALKIRQVDFFKNRGFLTGTK